MLKKIFLLLTALFTAFSLIACASDKPKSPFSLLAPKQLTYQKQTFDLVKAERTTVAYGTLTYADKDNHQLHYLLASMVIPLDKLQANLTTGENDQKFQLVDNKLYALTKQTLNNRLVYKQSVSQNFDCGTLTVIKNSPKRTALIDKELAATLDQMKCQKNE